MIDTEKIRILLLEGLVQSQVRNPHYSMRAYAKKVGYPQSAVSEILAGKRTVTQKAAKRILEGLDLTPEEASSYLGHQSGIQSYEAIDMDTYHAISDWHYFAILSLIETKDFQSSPKWIASRLGITEKKAVEAVESLDRLGMIKRDSKSKKITPTGKQFEAVSAVRNQALKKANRQNLELATQALDNIPPEERDFTAITLAMDPDRLVDARKLIKNFRRNFTRVMESSSKKEVYKLTIQMFPLTKRDHT